MSIIIFTDEQLKQLQDNSYVKNVSSKAITYTREFKELFLREYDDGKKPTEIFRNAGFDTKALGSSRIFSFYHRITNKGIEDNRKGNSGRPFTNSKKELTLEEELKLVKHKNALLEQENEFLKKMIFLGRENFWLKSLQEKDTK